MDYTDEIFVEFIDNTEELTKFIKLLDWEICWKRKNLVIIRKNSTKSALDTKVMENLLNKNKDNIGIYEANINYISTTIFHKIT